MGFENPFKNLLKKATPPEKPDTEEDKRDPVFHEETKEKSGEKFIEKNPEDYKKEGQEKEEVDKI